MYFIAYINCKSVQYNTLQLLPLQTLPAPRLSKHLGTALADGEDGKHGVDGGHVGEDTGVGDTQVLEAPDLELGVHDGVLVLGHVAHLGGAGGVVDGVGDAPSVGGQLLVGLALGARGDLALEPVLEGSLLGDLSRGLEAGDDGGGVVALRVGEVAEVEGGLDVGVGRGEVELAAGAGAGDVGGHAEGVDGGVEAHACCVEAEGDLVAVHHDVGVLGVVAVGVGDLAAEEDAGVRVHGGLVGGDGLVELPHDDGLGVVDQVLTYTGEVLDNGDVEGRELLLGAETGEKHKTGGIDCTGAENGLALGREGVLAAVLKGDINAGDLVAGSVDLADPSVGENSQVLTLLGSAKNGVDVCNRCAGSAAIVGVV